jgi:WD repeat-containing protein 45
LMVDNQLGQSSASGEKEVVNSITFN